MNAILSMVIAVFGKSTKKENNFIFSVAPFFFLPTGNHIMLFAIKMLSNTLAGGLASHLPFIRIFKLDYFLTFLHKCVLVERVLHHKTCIETGMNNNLIVHGM